MNFKVSRINYLRWLINGKCEVTKSKTSHKQILLRTYQYSTTYREQLNNYDNSELQSQTL